MSGDQSQWNAQPGPGAGQQPGQGAWQQQPPQPYGGQQPYNGSAPAGPGAGPANPYGPGINQYGSRYSLQDPNAKRNSNDGGCLIAALIGCGTLVLLAVPFVAMWIILANGGS